MLNSGIYDIGLRVATFLDGCWSVIGGHENNRMTIIRIDGEKKAE